MSGTFNAAVGDVGTFFNRATDEGQIFQNPLTDIGIASAVLLPFLAPELLAGLGGADLAGAGAAAAPDLAAGSVGSSALGFAGDVGAGTAADTGALGVINAALTPASTMSAADLAAAAGNVLPEIGVTPPLDLTASATAADAALADGGGAAAGGLGAAGAGGAARLGDALGAAALTGGDQQSLGRFFWRWRIDSGRQPRNRRSEWHHRSPHGGYKS